MWAAWSMKEMNGYQRKHPNDKLTIASMITGITILIVWLLMGTLIYMHITKIPFVAIIISFILIVIIYAVINKK
jgi:uncharacterized protein YacL